MAGEQNLEELRINLAPSLNEGEYVFVSVKSIDGIPEKDILSLFQEKEGITLIISKGKADELGLGYDFIASWITLNVHSSLKAVGLTAMFSSALSENEISCNVVAGFFHDHIFVDRADATKTLEILKNLSKG